MQKLNDNQLINICGGGILSKKISIYLNDIYNDIRYFVLHYGLKWGILHF